MKEKLYLVKFDFGLYYAFGESIEILTEEELQKVKDFIAECKEVYLGEIEGKHSDVYGPLETTDFEIISEDQEKIKAFQELIGDNFGAFCMTSAINESLEED